MVRLHAATRPQTGHKGSEDKMVLDIKTLRWAATAIFATVLSAAPMAQAQVTDPRLFQLEEQVRMLTGQLEELNFQLLQMQETLRKQQEDNEFRLQQLEEKQQGAVSPSTTTQPETGVAEAAPDAVAPNAPADGGQLLAAPAPAQAGEPPRTLGTLTVDPSGNVLGAGVDFSAPIVPGAGTGLPSPSGDVSGAIDPQTLYQTGYRHVLDGDYKMAEEVFRSFVDIHPDDPLSADAHFWLGEAVLAQGRFEDAATIFIDARARYPQAGKAAETKLKIGAIMAALGNRDVACATFADAVATHPDMTVAVRNSIEAERAKLRC